MRTSAAYRYNSLEDFLISNPLEIDGCLEDGQGAIFPAKGREIDAAILFIDISNFSKRTLHLSPTVILIFVNNFFAWVTAEGLRDRPGIVDKYIGDEMMVVFAREFGSKDPFLDAVQTACAMIEKDSLAYCPHIGIAAGSVTVGYVGTPLKYNCSVFGQPVALAARCAGIKSINGTPSRIIFPAIHWGDRTIAQRLGEAASADLWKLQPARVESIKNMPDLEVQELTSAVIHIPPPGFSAVERAKESFEVLKNAGCYRPLPFNSTRL